MHTNTLITVLLMLLVWQAGEIVLAPHGDITVITDIIADRMMLAKHGNIKMHQYQMLKNVRVVRAGAVILQGT